VGLDTSHGAFHGPYSAFSRWRKALAEAAGGDMTVGPEPSMAWFTYEESVFTKEQEYGFREIMGHSDCDGEIGPDACRYVAAALEALLPRIRDDHPGVRELSMRQATERFMEGCREAHRQGEPLEFG